MKKKLLLLNLLVLFLSSYIGAQTNVAPPQADYTYTLPSEATVIDQALINMIAQEAKTAKGSEVDYEATIIIPQGMSVEVKNETTFVTIPSGMSLNFFGNGDANSRATLIFPYRLDIPGNHAAIRLQNLNLVGNPTEKSNSLYLFNQSGTATNTSTIKITSCKLSNFGRAIIRLQSSGGGSVTNFIVDDCIFQDLGFEEYPIIYNQYANGGIENVEITNSTFDTCINYIIRHNNTNGGAFKTIKFSDCTFYNCIGNGRYFIDNTANFAVDITIKNVIMGKLYLGTGTVGGKGIRAKGNQVCDYTTFDNYYQLSDVVWGGNKINAGGYNYPGTYQSTYSSEETFVDPDNHNFNSYIDVDIEAGDPRWDKIKVDTIEVKNQDEKTLRYAVKGNKLEVVKGENPYSGVINIPEMVVYNNNEYKVVSIDEEAFAYNNEISAVTIPNSVTSIGEYAFEYCSGLTFITIPNSVTSIGKEAFRDCSSLQKVIVPDIAAWCGISFSGSAANPLYYAHHLYSDNNTEITELVIPDGVTSIGRGVFYGCSGLTSITIPNSVTSIGGYAFSGCSGLTSITIPNSVTSIESYAFSHCTGLTSITIPNSVTSIGLAFYNCTGLTAIYSYIENPTSSTGANFDSSNYSNATLYVPFGTKNKYLATDGWKDFSNIEEMSKKITIGDYYYSLYSDHAEMEGIVNSLSGDVVIPSTVEYEQATYTVTKVNSLTTYYYYDETEGTYKYVKYSTYYDDGVPVPDYTKVTSITLEDGIESVSDNNLCAYWYCKVVNFPKSISYISPETYYMRYMSGSGYQDDSRIDKEIYYTLVFNDITYNVDAENKVYASRDGVLYDKEMKNLLRCPRGWEGKFIVPDGVEKIDRFGFFFCPLITEIQLPASVKVLGDDGGEWAQQSRLFGACYSLEKINIPEGVERIESMSFRNCLSLKELTMPNSLKYYNTRALASNKALESFDWQDCELETLEIEDNFSIFDYSHLCTISLPKSVKNIISTYQGYPSSNGTMFSGGIAPEELTLPASIETFEVTQMFSTSFNSEKLAPLKKLYVLMDFMPDISESFFGYDQVKVGKITQRLFPQTWADQCTLYVPENLVEAYKAHEIWSKFPNIVGVEVKREIAPIEEETAITFDESDFINIDNNPVDLNNTVVNDTYFCINNTSVANPDGFYDSTEKCIVINKATSSDAIATAVASDLGSSDFISNYTGIVIEVNGQGSVKINAQTIGNNKLAVKIGNADAKTYTQATKGDVTINYDVTENTYVYIYAVDANNQQQSLSMDVTDTSDNAVKVYSVTVTPDATAIETVASTIPASIFGKVYSIDGKQLSQPQKGLNILKMSDGTTRKVVK